MRTIKTIEKHFTFFIEQIMKKKKMFINPTIVLI